MKKKNQNNFLCGLYSAEQEYFINGVRYVVESRFESFKDKNITTIADRFGKVITSNFTQSPSAASSDTMSSEYGSGAWHLRMQERRTKCSLKIKQIQSALQRFIGVCPVMTVRKETAIPQPIKKYFKSTPKKMVSTIPDSMWMMDTPEPISIVPAFRHYWKIWKCVTIEKKQVETELQKSIVRIDTVSRMYEKLYEDNVSGKVTDDWFMQLSHKYEVERFELKNKVVQLKDRLNSIGIMQQNKDQFIETVRK